jgi:hypothetical protein
MELRRITRQHPETLEEFFDPAEWPYHSADGCQLMRSLLEHLKHADQPPVWAFTSHWSLVLTDADESGNWLMTIAIERENWMDRPRFKILCAAPDPWYATVGYAEEPTDAALLVVDGLRRAAPGKRRNVTFE